MRAYLSKDIEQILELDFDHALYEEKRFFALSFHVDHNGNFE